MTEKQIQKQESDNTNSKTKFIDLLLKEEQKSKIESKYWTKVRLKDIEVYNSYIAQQKGKNGPTRRKKIICNDGKDFQKLLQNHTRYPIKKYDDKSYSVSVDYNFTDPKTYNENNGKWVYENCNIIILTISDLNNNYTKKIPIIPKYEDNQKEILYNLKNEKYLQIRDRWFNNNYIIRYDHKQPSVQNLIIENILSITLSIIIFFIPFILFYILLNINPSISFIVSLVSMLITIKLIEIIQKIKNDKKFKSLPNVNISKLPEDAEITDLVFSKRDLKYTNANISIKDNGDVTIKNIDENIIWNFPSEEESIPCKQSKQLHQIYGSRFEANTIPIKYYKYNPVRDDVKDNNMKYLDQESKWVLEPNI